MNVLCLDFGLKRIGVAVAATENGIAFERPVVRNTKTVFDDLKKLIEKDHIGKILVGMPYKRDGSVGDIDEQLQVFVLTLQQHSQLSVELIDERYTTKIAQQKMKDVKRHVRFKYLDSIAAQVILQEWLERNL